MIFLSHVRTQYKDIRLHTKEKALSKNRACGQPDLRLPASRALRNQCLLFKPWTKTCMFCGISQRWPPACQSSRSSTLLRLPGFYMAFLLLEMGDCDLLLYIFTEHLKYFEFCSEENKFLKYIVHAFHEGV
uniref:Uncharacterized protein n=1 Tax=Molossus molossus TaxID=27622 RepID=A0A7J8JWW1_MOLMO|nr:hypothetical protein HJG59_007894 [Molossus molossus]